MSQSVLQFISIGLVFRAFMFCCPAGGTPTLAPPPPFAQQYTFLPGLMGRPPPPPPFYPQILYWPYPSPPVSPPQPPSTLLIMHTDPTNLLHSVPEVSHFQDKLFWIQNTNSMKYNRMLIYQGNNRENGLGQ